MEGWIKLHRKLFNSRVFLNEGLLKVWVWCLLMANHEENWVEIKTGRGVSEVKVVPGQFIFGRHSAAKKLKMKPDTVYSRMKKLKKIGNINMQNNTHYTLVTIVNWATYQGKEPDSQHKDQHPNNTQIPTKHQPNNTDKNEKNEDNEKKTIEKEFEIFWNLYDKRRDRKKCFVKWNNLKAKEKELIFETVEAYVKSTPDKQYRKNPLTWLNGECWNNEIEETKQEQNHVETVLKAIQQYGSYTTPKFDCPKLAEKVRAIGWGNICKMSERDLNYRLK